MATFRKKWFNPLYFILNKVKENHTIKKVFVYGGKGSAKTISICQFLSKEAYVCGASALTFRKESARIPDTLKHSFNLSQETMFLENGFERLDRKYNALNNGAMIGMRGMDDSEKAKGVEGYQYLYFDELNQFSYNEYEQATLSLRGKPGQKFFGSWNPISDQSWIKVDVLDKSTWTDTDEFGKLPHSESFVRISDCGSMLLIKTTYEDNYWMAGSPCGTYGYRDEATIADYKKLERTNPNSYKVNVLGEWGKSVFGGEFLKAWRSDVHVDDCQYNPDLALYLMFDENVTPYFPCAFVQTEDIDNIKYVNIVHIIAAKNPDNRVKKVGPMICSKLRAWGHIGPVFVGGDATSQKEDVKQEKGHDLFKLIMGELQGFTDVRRFTNSANPSVVLSGQFTNEVLENEFEGIRVRVNRACRTAINDFENTKEDKNGKVDKSSERDPVTGQTYQPWGHFCDILRYTLVCIFPNEYKKFQTGGYITRESYGKLKRKNDW